MEISLYDTEFKCVFTTQNIQVVFVHPPVPSHKKGGPGKGRGGEDLREGSTRNSPGTW